MAGADHLWTDADRATVRTCLERIVTSPSFAQARRLQRFLRFIVTETLAGHPDRLKGYAIAVEVFDRDPSFDPGIDAVVRVEAARLRAKLRDYYDAEGRDDPVRLIVPKGRYAVRLERGDTKTHVQSAAPVDARPSLAVLPFLNMSSDPEQGYFADGITDTLITELSRLPGLFVISRHSSFAYRTASKRAEDIGRELGVKYLLEGSVQRAGQRVRITTRLVDAAKGAHLWAERFDRELNDIFAVEDDVVRSVLSVLQVKLTGAGAGRTQSLEAHDCLLRGLEQLWVQTEKAAEEARTHFSRAVELDPTYAAAHAWLARTLVFRWVMLWDSAPEGIERAYEHARRAVDLAPELPQAHAVLCWVQLWRRQGDAAIAAGSRAVSLNPNDADAHLFLCLTLAAAGRGQEALHYIEKGMRLNPHPSSLYYFAEGFCYYVLEDYERAIAALKRGTELRKAFFPNHYSLCLAYTLLGREEEARAERDLLLKLTGGRTPVMRRIYLDEDLRKISEELERRAGLREGK